MKKSTSTESSFTKTEYKLTVLGGGGVGKTAFTVQMCSSHFVDYRRQVVIDGYACMLDVLDTAGQEELSALRSQWIRSGEGFLLLYSITDKTSFDELEEFRTQILHVKDVTESEAPPMVLVGNKCDLPNRQVPTSSGAALAKAWGCDFMEASAKTRLNVDESFFCIVRKIRELEGVASPEDKTKPRKAKSSCLLF